MAKVNKQGSQGPEKKVDAAPTKGKQVDTTPTKGKQVAKSSQSRVGGTAIQGAKSTQPKEITATNPQQQQAESYNRTMRRRMEHLGAGPSQTSGAKDPRQKRLEKRKRRIEERKQEAKKVAATGPRTISLGRRNTYFLIAVVAVIILVVIVAYFINHH
jgi:hypothetical protein